MKYLNLIEFAIFSLLKSNYMFLVKGSAHSCFVALPCDAPESKQNVNWPTSFRKRVIAIKK